MTYRQFSCFLHLLDWCVILAYTTLMEAHLKAVYSLSFLLFWFALEAFFRHSLRFRGVSSKVADDTRNRIVSLVHILGCVFLSAVLMLTQHSINDHPDVFAVQFTVMYSMTYFLYDTVALLRTGQLDFLTALHHAVVALMEFEAVRLTYGVHYGVLALFVSEFSNLLLHVRTIMRNFGRKYSRAYDLVEDGFIFIYVIARGLLIPLYCIVPSLLEPRIDLGVKAGMVLLGVQSAVFITTMLRIVRKNAKRRREMREKGVEFGWWDTPIEQLQQLSFYSEGKEGKEGEWARERTEGKGSQLSQEEAKQE